MLARAGYRDIATAKRRASGCIPTATKYLRVALACLTLGGDRGVLALQEHRQVREAERRTGLGVAVRGRVGHEVDARL
jgi:hypothetical protein